MLGVHYHFFPERLQGGLHRACSTNHSTPSHIFNGLDWPMLRFFLGTKSPSAKEANIRFDLCLVAFARLTTSCIHHYTLVARVQKSTTTTKRCAMKLSTHSLPKSCSSAPEGTWVSACRVSVKIILVLFKDISRASDAKHFRCLRCLPIEMTISTSSPIHHPVLLRFTANQRHI